MTNIWKGDVYRLAKSRTLYAVAGGVGLLSLLLTIMMRMDIHLGVGGFGASATFKEMEDVIHLGLRHNHGLGLFIAVFIAVFIGQEYTWKTWQNKWLAGRSRVRIYLSKLALSVAASISTFLLFQLVALLGSGQIREILTGEYLTAMLRGSFLYGALGAVLCMLSMLLQNATASVIFCLGYILFGETLAHSIRTLARLGDAAAQISEWIVNHSIYGMSSDLFLAPASPVSVLATFVNAVVIILLSAACGIFFFRKYEL